jgi:hypothetical protein
MYYLENMSFSRKELVRLSGLPNGFVSAAIGFVFGLWFIGFKNVFPWNLEWLNKRYFLNK